MASTYLFRANGSGTGTTKGTISLWFKRGVLSSAQYLHGAYIDGNNRFKIEINSSDKLEINNINGGSDTIILNTNRVFRDVASWYHLVLRVDTTQSTAADRVRLYINGVQETSFSSSTYPSQNDTNWKTLNSGSTIDIGAYNNGGGSSAGSRTACFDGLMTHYVFTDGQSNAPTVFGEVDSTSGIWKIKTAPSVTYGNNGFFLKFENSGALGTDSSGNTNTFTLSGSGTQSIDTPSINYPSMNYLYISQSMGTLSQQNLRLAGAGGWGGRAGTIGFSKGKWYWEVQCGNSGNAHFWGIVDTSADVNQSNPQNMTGSTVFYNGAGGEIRKDGSETSADYGTFSDTDYCGMAVDFDAGTMSIYKNGSAIVTNYGISSTKNLLLPIFMPYDDAMKVNFGTGSNGAFTVSSNSGNGYSDGNSQGIFQYAPPTGYYAINSKNLNTYG